MCGAPCRIVLKAHRTVVFCFRFVPRENALPQVCFNVWLGRLPDHVPRVSVGMETAEVRTASVGVITHVGTGLWLLHVQEGQKKETPSSDTVI